MYFVLKGHAEAICTIDGRALYRVLPKRHFGEDVLTGRRRVATHRAVSLSN